MLSSLKALSSKDKLKILIIKYGPLGEVILTSPLIRVVKESFPRSYLTLLCDRPSYSIYSHNPYVDELIFWEGRRFKGHGLRGLIGYLRYLKSLRDTRFDLVIDAYGGSRPATWSMVSGAKVRVGYTKRGIGLFYNVKAKHNFYQYHCECVLDLARVMGLEISSREPEIYISEDDERHCNLFLEQNGFKKGQRLLVGINPNSSNRYKRWGVERFAELADRIVKSYSAAIVLMGGPGEEGVAQAVGEKMEAESAIANITNFMQWAAFIKSFDLFITNDSSPLHVSACVKTTPTVAIFTSGGAPTGPSGSLEYLPKGGHYRAVQRRVDCTRICFAHGAECDQEDIGKKRCLDLIEVNQVFKAVKELLDR